LPLPRRHHCRYASLHVLRPAHRAHCVALLRLSAVTLFLLCPGSRSTPRSRTASSILSRDALHMGGDKIPRYCRYRTGGSNFQRSPRAPAPRARRDAMQPGRQANFPGVQASPSASPAGLHVVPARHHYCPRALQGRKPMKGRPGAQPQRQLRLRRRAASPSTKMPSRNRRACRTCRAAHLK
jgi:hypothetical protein